jgi:hypothetical protein
MAYMNFDEPNFIEQTTFASFSRIATDMESNVFFSFPTMKLFQSEYNRAGLTNYLDIGYLIELEEKGYRIDASMYPRTKKEPFEGLLIHHDGHTD